MEVNLNTNSLDYKKIQERLNELSKKYLPIIYEEYGKYMSSEQLQLLYTLLTSDCIKVEQDGENYLQNQKIEIINSSMSEEDKNEKLKELDIPLAHGGRVFNDNIIHFYPSIISENRTSEEILRECESLLIHELLHYFIRPQLGNTINNKQINDINSFITEGLVDMCARDIQIKYGLYPNYSSDYGRNVLFVREALSNIPNADNRMRLVFNGSIEQFLNDTCTQYEQYINSKSGNTNFDKLISSICSIVSDDSKKRESIMRSTYNYSANFQSKNDALTGIRNFGLSTFPDKIELIDGLIKSYSNPNTRMENGEKIKDGAIIEEKNKPKTLVRTMPSKSTSNNGFVNFLLLLFILGFVFGLAFTIAYLIIK